MQNTTSGNYRAGPFPLLPDKAPGEDVFRVSEINGLLGWSANGPKK